jgi:hypothetical protein
MSDQRAQAGTVCMLLASFMIIHILSPYYSAVHTRLHSENFLTEIALTAPRYVYSGKYALGCMLWDVCSGMTTVSAAAEGGSSAKPAKMKRAKSAIPSSNTMSQSPLLENVGKAEFEERAVRVLGKAHKQRR